jgi:hypothetical protein
VLVTGSRTWDRDETVRAALAEVRDFDKPEGEVTLVSGACPTGADILAEGWARRFGWKVERHPADWKRYGKRAGPIRNAEMVRSGIDLCLAFQRDNSRGTQHTVELCAAAGIPVRRWSEETE